jgi:hypothetical protein
MPIQLKKIKSHEDTRRVSSRRRRGKKTKKKKTKQNKPKQNISKHENTHKHKKHAFLCFFWEMPTFCKGKISTMPTNYTMKTNKGKVFFVYKNKIEV